MKINMLLIAMLMVVNTVAAQQEMSKQDYLAKSKKQTTTAKILLGAGGAMVLTGIFVITDDIGGFGNPGDKQNSSLADVLGYTGAAVTAASIPFFVAAGRNKRKAMTISFKIEPLRQLQQSSFVYSAIPSINLKFQL